MKVRPPLSLSGPRSASATIRSVGLAYGCWQLVSESESLGNRIGAQPASLYATSQRFQLLRHTGRVAEAETGVRGDMDAGVRRADG